MILTIDNFDFHYESFLSPVKIALDSIMQDFSCVIELSLNHPESVPWKKLSAFDQEHKYFCIYKDVLELFQVKKSKITYERCLSGKIHAHMWFAFDHCHNRQGLVCQISQLWYDTMTKRHMRNAYSLYNYTYDRIKAESLCCQYVHGADLERTAYWAEYILKQVVNPKPK